MKNRIEQDVHQNDDENDDENDDDEQRAPKVQRTFATLETTLFHQDCVAGMKRIEADSVQLVIADPPYENVVGASWDKLEANNYVKFSRTWLKEATRVLRPGGSILVYGSPERTWIARIAVMLEDEFDFNVNQTACWVYNQGGGSRVSTMKKLAVQHELLLWASKKGSSYVFNASDCCEHYTEDERAIALAKGKGRVSNESLDRGRPPRSFLDFNRENSRSKERRYGNHPSMKPLPLCEHIVKLFSNPGDSVVVPFVGSGSELISAATLGRLATGYELHAQYVEIARKRFEGHGLRLNVPALAS